MVYEKKTPVKAKQKPAKAKKSFEDDNMDTFFDNESDDSGSNQVVKKTPSRKTPKGKQPQNDKRVSFQLPGKNTPSNKGTPKGTLVGKKQATPAKVASLKEFQGMLTNSSAKKNGNAKKATSDDEDDDDDDDEDLDMLGGDDDDEDDDDDEKEEEEEEEEEEKEEEEKSPKSKLNAKQQNQTENAAEDDDNEDDDDEEEEDDDDDNNEAEEMMPKNKQNAKQQNQTPAKTAETIPAKNTEKTEKGDISLKEELVSPKKTEKKIINPVIKNFVQLDAERRREKDKRTLFIGNLPKDIRHTELKALSTDILNVSIPRNPAKRRNVFAFLEFASESKAEENFTILKSKKLRGEPLKVDYTGEKGRKNIASSEHPAKEINPKKLYIADLPFDVTMDKVANFFPKSVTIVLNRGPTFKSGSVLFASAEDAAEALEAAKGAKIGAKPITVDYSFQRDDRGRNKKRKRSKCQQNKSGVKKMKLAANQDDEDDDDDDEDEE